ncbi:hypothetical protein Celaphus_00003191 [Cervus elaphus hippelaphus]|uniref:Uncharacterized protein n=1 Tax=Cervus elaphus hippelaphus TaxID=46360 RepID=A0A212D0L2_CEREH|nr:hypothetical protein Celaphus_00003191 [Cervus elaphus hippelaphus]
MTFFWPIWSGTQWNLSSALSKPKRVQSYTQSPTSESLPWSLCNHVLGEMKVMLVGYDVTMAMTGTDPTNRVLGAMGPLLTDLSTTHPIPQPPAATYTSTTAAVPPALRMLGGVETRGVRGRRPPRAGA